MCGQYNWYCKTENGYVILNGLTGAVDLCDDATAAALSEHRETVLPDTVLCRLRERGYLLSEEQEAEYLEKVSKGLDALAGLKITLSFLPTYNCNFRCTYCFEKHRLEKGMQWLETVMQPAFVERIYNLMDAKTFVTKVREVYITGGEPLLPECRETVEQILKGAKHRNLLCAVLTNGYYLDQYQDLFLSFRAQFDYIQITLDGTANSHDRTRILKDGSGSWEKIAANIDSALEKGLPITVRMNVDEANAAEKDLLKEEAKRRGWEGAENFSLYFANVQRGLYPGIQKNLSEEDPHEEILDAIRAGKILPLKNICCGALKPAWIVDPFGKVYSCYNFVGKDRLSYAAITENGIDLNFKQYVELRTRKSNRMEKCRTCPFLFLCAGGCPAQAVMGGGRIGDADCGYFASDLETELKKMIREDPVIKEKLAGTRAQEHYLIPLTKSVLQMENRSGC